MDKKAEGEKTYRKWPRPESNAGVKASALVVRSSQVSHQGANLSVLYFGGRIMI